MFILTHPSLITIGDESSQGLRCGFNGVEMGQYIENFDLSIFSIYQFKIGKSRRINQWMETEYIFHFVQ